MKESGEFNHRIQKEIKSRDGSDVACCRMNIPLKLSWSFTPWKVQGQTIPPDLLLNHFKRRFVHPG